MFVFADWREPMANEEDGTSGSRPAGDNDPHSRLPTRDSQLPTSDSRLVIDGHTFWRARTARGTQRAIELTTATGIEVDPERCRWTISTPGSRGVGEPVESRSREVYRFMAGVLGSMQRATRRATVRPAPKPVPKAAPAIPPTAPVPCPLCRGEAWPDCELCDGAGIVMQRLASEWLDEREPHRSD
jgi:transposase InsO family protein